MLSMTCCFCVRGLANRCINGLLDGGQAEIVRVPFADGTLHNTSTDMDERLLINNLPGGKFLDESKFRPRL